MAIAKSQIISDRSQSIPLTLQTLEQTLTAYHRYQTHALREHGLTPTQYAALQVLHQSGEPMVLTTLAQSLSVSKGTLSSLLQRLMAKGWLYRTEHEVDRRSSRVGLSAAGVALIQTLAKDYSPREQAALKGVESSELDLLRILLYKVEQAFRASTPGLDPSER